MTATGNVHMEQAAVDIQVETDVESPSEWMDLNCLEVGLDHPNPHTEKEQEKTTTKDDEAEKDLSDDHSTNMVQAQPNQESPPHGLSAQDALESNRPMELKDESALGNFHSAPECSQGSFEERCGIEERIAILKSCVAFTARMVDERCIRQFASKLRPREVPAGTVLCRRGDTGDPMYFIATGSCLCSLNGRELERLGAGQSFGEVSFINQCKLRKRGVEPQAAKAQCLRGADIETLERCELLALHCEDAWPLIKLSPNLWSLPALPSAAHAEKDHGPGG